MLLKTKNVLKSECCVTPLRSDRKIIGRTPRSKQIFRGHCAEEFPPWLAVTRCRVGSHSCSLNNITLVPKLRLPLLRRHCVGFVRSTCDFVPTSYGFVRAAIFLHALVTVCVLVPLPTAQANHYLRISFFQRFCLFC